MFVSKSRAERLLAEGSREARDINDLCYLAYSWMLKNGVVATTKMMYNTGWPYGRFDIVGPTIYQSDLVVATKLAWEVYAQTHVLKWAKSRSGK